MTKKQQESYDKLVSLLKETENVELLDDLITPYENFLINNELESVEEVQKILDAAIEADIYFIAAMAFIEEQGLIKDFAEVMIDKEKFVDDFMKNYDKKRRKKVEA